MKRVVVIFGPTGVGKSEIGVSLSKKINGEIISCDAYQVYRFMDFGTNKISVEEMENIPHHLINIINPNEDFSAGLFKELAEKKIDEITEKGKMPILVGGTGLYMRTLLYYEPPKRDEMIREILNQKLKEFGLEKLYEELKNVDPIYANKINKNDKKRILRALEVYYIYKKPLSEFLKEEERFDSIKFGLIMDRNLLYKKIEERVNKMFEKGFIEEVKFIKENFGFSKTSIKAIGYELVLKYLNNEINLDECKNLMIKKTKDYARRQIIWLRKEKDIIILDISNKDKKEVTEIIVRIIRERWKI